MTSSALLTADGPYWHEILCRIEIILAGFVDDARVTVVRGGRVWENLVDLSQLQIVRPAVADAQYELGPLLRDFQWKHSLSILAGMTTACLE